MTRLPADLQDKIRSLFNDEAVRFEVSKSLDQLWDGGINVGAAQLARAIVFLSNGNNERFWELRRRFMGDPRDLLCEANSHLENSKYWFSQPYSEMGPLKADSNLR